MNVFLHLPSAEYDVLTFVITLSKSTTMLCRFSSAANTSGRTADIFRPLDLSITDFRLSKASLQVERRREEEDNVLKTPHYTLVTYTVKECA